MVIYSFPKMQCARMPSSMHNSTIEDWWSRLSDRWLVVLLVCPFLNISKHENSLSRQETSRLSCQTGMQGFQLHKTWAWVPPTDLMLLARRTPRRLWTGVQYTNPLNCSHHCSTSTTRFVYSTTGHEWKSLSSLWVWISTCYYSRIFQVCLL